VNVSEKNGTPCNYQLNIFCVQELYPFVSHDDNI